MRPEERVDALTRFWEYGGNTVPALAGSRMAKSIADPSLGSNVPTPNLFEQWRASGTKLAFGAWVKAT